MKNNKFVSLSDFKNTLVINGFNGEMIEKAEHKVHKYLRKEGGKYIYDYDKMNVKEHEDASWEHHIQHIVNDTKAEGRKMAKDKELEEHYRKHAAYHKEEKEKHTKLAEEKSAHKNHKYLKIENGKYIYDHSKMTSKDHFDAAELHEKEADKHRNLMEVNKKVGSKWHYEMGHRDMHKKLSSEHENLAYKKENEEKIFNKLKEIDKNKKEKISKSEAFDTLIPADFEERLEKSKGPWKKGKKMHSEEGDHQFKKPAISDRSKKLLEGNEDASEAAYQKKTTAQNKSSDELKKLAREHPTLDVLAHDFKINDDEIRVCVTKASYSQLGSTRKFLQEQGFNVKGGEVSAEAGPDYQVLIYKRV